MEVLVIDSRSRDMRIFVASATKTQDNDNHIVIRHALGMGGLLKWEEDGFKSQLPDRVDMSVLVMGQYVATGSAGHVSVTGRGGQRVLVVGGLGSPFGEGGLKNLVVPISGTLIQGPVEIKKIQTANNSNCDSTDAAMAGLRLLRNIDSKSVFLAEGQSDRVNVVRFRTANDNSRSVEFPLEHQDVMFSRKNIIRKMLEGQVFRFLQVCYNNEGREGRPSQEEIKKEINNRTERYLTQKKSRENVPWDILGKGFHWLKITDEELAKYIM